MDYSFKSLFLYSIIVNNLVFFNTTQGFDISTTTDTWDNAANHCSDNQLYKVKDNVLDDLDQHMSPGDALWVGARAKLTHYVSWDNCWKINRVIANHVKISYNSLASCLDYCNKYTRIALQNEVCSCISDEAIRNLEITPKDKSYCNNSCYGNMNDICGGDEQYVSVYTREIRNNKRAINSSLPWEQAFRECIQQNGHMVYPLQRSTIGLLSAFYWTSLRQSSAIYWQSKSDEEFPLCVFIMKTHTQGWMLQEEDCNIKHRFICDDEVSNSFPVWAIGLIVSVVIVLCSSDAGTLGTTYKSVQLRIS